MKTSLLLTSLFLFPLFAGCGETQHVRVTVVSEQQESIEGVTVNIRFLGTGSRIKETVTGLSNEDGAFAATGEPKLAVFIYCEKNGYYRTVSENLNNIENHDITLMLRKKKNPIPLHAKNVTLFFPENRKWLEYDLEKGDWLPPYGQGIYPDLRLKCDTEMTDEWEGRGTLEIVFEEGGGWVLERENYLPNSNMKMPHQAPLEGYTSLFKRQEDSFRNEKRRKNIGYFFRTRIVKNDGEVVQANYGKLLEDISFSPLFAHKLVKDEDHPESYATVSFSFYFNPTPNDRNVEFDPSRNLIEGLKYGARVNHP